MKLTKQQRKLHQEAVDLVERFHSTNTPLKLDEREFILRNWNPGADHNIGVHDAHFTPIEMARAIRIEFLNNRKNKTVLDACAGIGALTFAMLDRWDTKEDCHFVCMEINPTFIHVGQAVAPEATWVRGDILTQLGSIADEFGPFHFYVSNPPFGQSGSLAYRVLESLHHHIPDGICILPQGMTNWRLSGLRYDFRYEKNARYEKWRDTHGISLDPNCGIDLSTIPSDGNEDRCVRFANAKGITVDLVISNRHDSADYTGNPPSHPVGILPRPVERVPQPSRNISLPSTPQIPKLTEQLLLI